MLMSHAQYNRQRSNDGLIQRKISQTTGRHSYFQRSTVGEELHVPQSRSIHSSMEYLREVMPNYNQSRLNNGYSLPHSSTSPYQRFWDQQSSIHTPNQLNDAPDVYQQCGNRQNSSQYSSQNNPDEWGNRMINAAESLGVGYGGQWNDDEIMDIGNTDGLYISKFDRDYWNYCKKMDEELIRNMSEETKILLKMENSGHFFNSPSRLQPLSPQEEYTENRGFIQVR